VQSGQICWSIDTISTSRRSRISILRLLRMVEGTLEAGVIVGVGIITIIIIISIIGMGVGRGVGVGGWMMRSRL
jgi:hypothetical protein